MLIYAGFTRNLAPIWHQDRLILVHVRALQGSHILDALTYAGDLANLPGGTPRIDGMSSIATVVPETALAFKKAPVVLVHGDVVNAELVALLMETCDGAIHAAAETHVDRSYKRVGPFVKTNVEGTYAMLEGVRDTDKRLVHFSTDEVYGHQPEGFVQENDKLDPRNPYSSYGFITGTPVVLSSGRWVRIEDAPVDLVGFDPDAREVRFLRSVKKHRFRYSGPMVRIVTECGEVECTTGQPFYVKRPKRWASGRMACERDWSFTKSPVLKIKAADLRIGDFVASVREIPLQTPRNLWSTKLTRLMGYFVGDGNLNWLVPKSRTKGRWYIRLADEKKWLLKRYRAIAIAALEDKKLKRTYARALNLRNRGLGKSQIAAILGEPVSRVGHWLSSTAPRTPAFSPSPCFVRHPTRNCWYLQFGCWDFVDLARSLGLNAPPSEKHIPWELFSASDEEVLEFIAGEYDADGSASGSSIGIASNSFGLLLEIAHLFRRFGIIGRIVPPPPGSATYRLAITDGRSLKLFLKHVPTFKKPRIRLPKPQRMNNDPRLVWARVQALKPFTNRAGEVFSFSMPDPGTFLANGFVVAGESPERTGILGSEFRFGTTEDRHRGPTP